MPHYLAEGPRGGPRARISPTASESGGLSSAYWHYAHTSSINSNPNHSQLDICMLATYPASPPLFLPFQSNSPSCIESSSPSASATT
ncbi:hypothetical protein AB1N83_010060 [Pleurotus pulmonarius]